MAVDSHNLFLSNREFMMNNNNNFTMEQTNGVFCNNSQTCYDVVSPFSVINYTTTTPPLLQIYGGSGDTIPTTTAADYYGDAAGISALPTRKRSRDSSVSNYYYHPPPPPLLQNPRSSSSSSPSCVSNTTPFSFLGQNIDIDISSHLNQQQHEIDRFVHLHMEKVRYEIEEKRKKQARTIMEAIELRLVKRIRVKEEESNRISKINHALEERVKSLSVENQIWRDLAQSNEATVNHLRKNLDEVLAQVNNNVRGGGGVGLEEDDAQSCCGSSSDMRTVASEAQDKGVVRMCRNCGEVESCVLILPCRHLCLCGTCGTNVHTCPICSSPKTASVHVNMSS